MQTILRSIVFSSIGLFVSSAQAYLPQAKMPVCMNGPDAMQVDNARVLKFKSSTRNQYLDRGFVEGKVLKAPGIKNDHDHFVIAIGPGERDTLEIIYNREFGDMPSIRVGDRVVVCGDYITANAKAGGYDPSPEGAIIHWVHFNPGTRSSSAFHEHGYIVVESDLIGFDESPVGNWNGEIYKSQQPTGQTRTTTYPKMGEASDEPVVTEPTDSEPQNRDKQKKTEKPKSRGRSGGGRQDERNPGRWKSCRSLEECSARNGTSS